MKQSTSRLASVVLAALLLASALSTVASADPGPCGDAVGCLTAQLLPEDPGFPAPLIPEDPGFLP